MFERPAGGWASTSESAKLVAPEGWTTYWLRNYFGTSVAVKGDKVVIGARLAYTGGAYVFTKPDGGWDNLYIVYKLIAPMSDTYSSSGSSISITGDVIYVCVTGIPGQVHVFPIPPGSETYTGSTVRLSAPKAGSTINLAR